MISVVVPAWNAEKTISDCLKALVNQDYNNYEIIVVDDGSTDRTRKIIENWQKRSKKIRLIVQKNLGPAAARNTGWRAAKGEVIVFTDADSFAPPDWLKDIVAPLRNKRVAAVGGSYRTKNIHSKIARWIDLEIAYRHSKMDKYVDFVASYSLAMKKKVLERVNGFDESFKKASGEDNDLCYKIRDLGYNIFFNKRVWVWHAHEESFCKYIKNQFIHAKWRIYLYRKHPKRISGDKYTSLSTHFLPPLYLLTGLALIASIFYNILPLFISLATLCFLVHFPFSIWCVRKTKRLKDFFILFFAFARTWAWTLGMLAGLKFLFKKVGKE